MIVKGMVEQRADICLCARASKVWRLEKRELRSLDGVVLSPAAMPGFEVQPCMGFAGVHRWPLSPSAASKPGLGESASWAICRAEKSSVLGLGGCTSAPRVRRRSI